MIDQSIFTSFCFYFWQRLLHCWPIRDLSELLSMVKRWFSLKFGDCILLKNALHMWSLMHCKRWNLFVARASMYVIPGSAMERALFWICSDACVCSMAKCMPYLTRILQYGSNHWSIDMIKYTPALYNISKVIEVNSTPFHTYADGSQLCMTFRPKCASSIINTRNVIDT